MTNSRKILIIIISIICACSIVLNVYEINTKMNQTEHIQQTEMSAMAQVAADISNANQRMGEDDKHYSLGRIAEAAGTLKVLSDILFRAKDIKTYDHLSSVAYYLHYQISYGPKSNMFSLKGITQFLRQANQLLQSHVVKGQYEISYLSSDAAKLERMIPKKFR